MKMIRNNSVTEGEKKRKKLNGDLVIRTQFRFIFLVIIASWIPLLPLPRGFDPVNNLGYANFSLSFNHYILMSMHIFLIDQMSFRIKCTFDYFVLNCYFVIESVRWIQVHPRNSNICLSCWWLGTQVLARVVSSCVSPLITLKIFLLQLVRSYICISLFFNQGLRILLTLS